MTNPPRNPKRARKKDRRDARREEWQRYVKRRRQRRLLIFASIVIPIAVIGVGWALATFAFDDDEQSAASSPTASAEAGAIITPKKTPVACDADVPDTAGKKHEQYGKAEDQKLDPDNTYIWRLETSCGDIDISLDVENSPKTSNSIAFLAREGFYDGTFFHRINESFVIQGGDPEGTGSGGSGYQVVEPADDDLKYEEGVVAMAKAGADPPGASGSQFFIVTGDEGEVLPPDYAYAGKVVDGMDVAKKIEEFASSEDGPPSEWTYIERSTIVEK
jgi:peptidyl-prolyl cis-trans isomerase B (cyclophilin B)